MFIPTSHTPDTHAHTNPTSIFQRLALSRDAVLAAARQAVVQVSDGFGRDRVPDRLQVLLPQVDCDVGALGQFGQALQNLGFDGAHQVLDDIEIRGARRPFVGLQRLDQTTQHERVVGQELLCTPAQHAQ